MWSKWGGGKSKTDLVLSKNFYLCWRLMFIPSKKICLQNQVEITLQQIERSQQVCILKSIFAVLIQCRDILWGEVHRRKFCWAVKWQGGDFLEEAEGEDRRTLMNQRRCNVSVLALKLNRSLITDKKICLEEHVLVRKLGKN